MKEQLLKIIKRLEKLAAERSDFIKSLTKDGLFSLGNAEGGREAGKAKMDGFKSEEAGLMEDQKVLTESMKDDRQSRVHIGGPETDKLLSPFAKAFKANILEPLRRKELGMGAKVKLEGVAKDFFDIGADGRIKNDRTPQKVVTTATGQAMTLTEPGVERQPYEMNHAMSLFRGVLRQNRKGEFRQETTASDLDGAAIAEGGAYTIGTWGAQTIPMNLELVGRAVEITNSELNEPDEVANTVQQRLRDDILDGVDSQFAIGTGTAPNWRGFFQTGNGINAAPTKGSRNKSQRILDAILDAQENGRDIVDLCLVGLADFTAIMIALESKDKSQLDIFRYNPIDGSVMCHTARVLPVAWMDVATTLSNNKGLALSSKYVEYRYENDVMIELVPVFSVTTVVSGSAGVGKTTPTDAVQFKGGVRGATRIGRPKAITQIDMS